MRHVRSPTHIRHHSTHIIQRAVQHLRELAFSEGLIECNRSARWSLLDRDDLMCLLAGMQSLRSCSGNVLFLIYHDYSREECPFLSPAGCEDTVQASLDARFRCGAGTSYETGFPNTVDPIQLLDAVSKHLAGLSDICSPCKESRQAAIERRQRSLWNELPGFFLLEEW